MQINWEGVGRTLLIDKELEPERLAIASLISTDSFLSEHLEPVLFDKEPLTGRIRLVKPAFKPEATK